MYSLFGFCSVLQFSSCSPVDCFSYAFHPHIDCSSALIILLGHGCLCELPLIDMSECLESLKIGEETVLVTELRARWVLTSDICKTSVTPSQMTSQTVCSHFLCHRMSSWLGWSAHCVHVCVCACVRAFLRVRVCACGYLWALHSYMHQCLCYYPECVCVYVCMWMWA